MEYLNSTDGFKMFLEDFGKIYDLEDFDTKGAMKIYDKISVGYAKFMPEGSMKVHYILAQQVFKHVEADEKLNKNCTILDVCCGTGIMGLCLRKAGFTGHLDGVDGSEGMLSQAAKLDKVYNKLHQEVIKLDGFKTVNKLQYSIVTVGHAFFPECLHADYIEALLDLLHTGGILAFNLNYDVVEGPTISSIYIDKIDTKLAQLIKDGVCERVFEYDVDNVFPRLAHLCPFGNSEFVHERHVCVKKL